MDRIRSILEHHPHRPGDAEVLARLIAALGECAAVCTECSDACLSEQEPGPMVRCATLCLDCSDICTTTSRVLGRQTAFGVGVVLPLLDACIAACSSCADECHLHAPHMEHCAECERACRECAAACAELLATMP